MMLYRDVNKRAGMLYGVSLYKTSSATKKGICRETNTLDAASVRNRLFQCLDTSAEIDMECCSIHHEGGYGLDTGSLRLFQTRFVVAEMDDLNIVFHRVKCIGYVLFGGNAYGAASVIENGFGFHNCSPGFVSATWHTCIVGTTPVPAKKALLGAPVTFWCNLWKIEEIKICHHQRSQPICNSKMWLVASGLSRFCDPSPRAFRVLVHWSVTYKEFQPKFCLSGYAN